MLAILAGIGVYVLVLPSPSSDWLGIASGLLSAACWAAYILLNRVVGRQVPGLQGPSVAATISAMLYLPVLTWILLHGQVTWLAIVLGIAAGVLSSAVPYVVDMLALRRVTPRFFSVFQSINPALAALAGMVILGQVLIAHEWIGIAIVSIVNVVAVLSARAAPKTSDAEALVPAVSPSL